MTDTVAPADGRRRSAEQGMLLAWWAQQQPDKPAIISPVGAQRASRTTRSPDEGAATKPSLTGDRQLTFAELNADANRLVRALRVRGLQAGDSIALLCGNSPTFAATVFACVRAGFRLTPINWHLTGSEAGYIVDNCEAKALIVDTERSILGSVAVEQAPRCVVRLASGDPMAGFGSYEDALLAERDDDIADPTPGGLMLYTSGTTGKPKGVYRSPESTTVARAMTDLNLFGYRESSDDLHLCTGPLYHAAPLAFSLVSPLNFGVGVVLMEAWDAEETLRLIQHYGITHTHMVPTMFHRLLSLSPEVRARYDTSTLRSVLHGAAPCPVHVKQRLIDWLGPVVSEYYAATEGTGTFVDSATWLARPGTVGKPFPPEQVIVGDEAGTKLPANKVGLVYMLAPTAGRFRYFNDGDKTSKTYRGDYFTLGDIGYMDADGYLFLTDRSADLIISGGVNIYPAEVDAILLDHPAVGDAATIGIPDPEWGEQVKSVVELQPGVAPSPELGRELLTYCRDRLAHYKCPRTVEFVDRLPRQDNGKIYKRLLREAHSAAVLADSAEA